MHVPSHTCESQRTTFGIQLFPPILLLEMELRSSAMHSRHLSPLRNFTGSKKILTLNVVGPLGSNIYSYCLVMVVVLLLENPHLSGLDRLS